MWLAVLFIGILLFILNVKAIFKEKKDFSTIFKDKFDNMDEFSMEIGKLRTELGKTIYELQQEIEDLKKELNIYKNEDNKEVDKETLNNNSSQIIIESNKLNLAEFESDDDEFEDNDYDKLKNNEISSEIELDNSYENNKNDDIININKQCEDSSNEEKKSSIKYEEINNLLKQGFSVDEISEKLNIGKGEVLLIIELYLK